MASSLRWSRYVAGLLAIIAVVAVCLAVVDSRGTSSATKHPHAGAGRRPKSGESLSDLLQRPVPVNNLWAETSQLKLGGRRVPRVVNARPPHYSPGHSDRFWVFDSADDTYHRYRATIICETPHLYLYIQDGLTYSRPKACRSAHRFETVIYPLDRRIFGTEWTPGIDDDPHISLYYGNLQGLAGYFSGENEYPVVVNRFSDQREIMFIDASTIGLATPDFYSTAAHEFQHMIHWHMHPQDEGWSNEGASMLAQVLNGYAADGDDLIYASHPVQLDSWSDGNNIPNYGAGFLWMDYLNLRFGNSFTHAVLADRRYSGLALTANVLARLHRRLTLGNVFGDWAVANYVNDRRLGARFSYRNSSIHVGLNHRVGPHRFTYRRSVPPFLPTYVEVRGLKGRRTIHFAGSRYIPVISAGPGPFWWSNRCDFCQTSMTRTIDLRHARRPVLGFDAWYRIEKDYDYAYVEVSTNGGRVWQSLKTPVGTPKNPNGGNFGNGITGSSAAVRGNHGGWVSVRTSLARYAGKRIRLRFQYITDDEYNGQSFAVRNIAVSAARYRDAVGSRGWKLDGFVPVLRNRLPAAWGIRIITFGSALPKERTVPVHDGRATIQISVRPGFRRAVIVVFAQAPKTTVRTKFVLQG
ncbi:MAG TPA: hypothetical protein VFB34_01445 [Chloroflexota bacterium]|nr:hypothetical protein [Chloroflexota bacterium]